MIRPHPACLLWAACLTLSACTTGAAKPTTSPDSLEQGEPTPAVQARTEHLEDAGFVVIETTCGIEVAVQVGTRSIRARIPIVDFETPDDNAALWEGTGVTVELFSLQGSMFGAPNQQNAELLEPFRTRELALAQQEAPDLDATAVALAPLASSETRLALDHWQLERRERKEPHRLDSSRRVYAVVGLDHVVVALLTHESAGETAIADKIHDTFTQSLHIENTPPDLAALGGVFAERDEQDPRCKQDPAVVRRAGTR